MQALESPLKCIDFKLNFNVPHVIIILETKQDEKNDQGCRERWAMGEQGIYSLCLQVPGNFKWFAVKPIILALVF